MKLTRADPFSLQLRGSIAANGLVGCWGWRHAWSFTGGLFDHRELIPAPQRLPNNIMHPTRHREIGSGSRFCERVMMSVRLTEPAWSSRRSKSRMPITKVGQLSQQLDSIKSDSPLKFHAIGEPL
jgi:hypothetical protein